MERFFISNLADLNGFLTDEVPQASPGAKTLKMTTCIVTILNVAMKAKRVTCDNLYIQI